PLPSRPHPSSSRFPYTPLFRSGEIAGKSPVDRGKQGTKRSLMTEANGIPIGCVTAPANRDDSPLLAPTLDTLTKFNGYLPEHITDRKSTRLNSSHVSISYAVFC